MKTAKEILTMDDACFPDGYAGALVGYDSAILKMEEYGDQFKPKWISVEDELPEIDEEDFYSIDFLVKGEIHAHGEFSHIGTTIGWMSREGEWNNIIPDKQKCYVTHYMPIPE